jgi:hypothetical protein
LKTRDSRKLPEKWATSPNDGAFVLLKRQHQEFQSSEVSMDQDRTPQEARAGIISGRIILVLILSCVGAISALGLAWAALRGMH